MHAKRPANRNSVVLTLYLVQKAANSIGFPHVDVYIVNRFLRITELSRTGRPTAHGGEECVELLTALSLLGDSESLAVFVLVAETGCARWRSPG